uniref:Endoplasmic reticulum aminopeptidase 1 n=1 Tax=Aquila chrysaetos chrysaetos TaxID=223781 RepID=A0A663EYL7_AQUCH
MCFCYLVVSLKYNSVNIMPWLVKDHFDTTVKMTTYLVAFIISDFKSISKITGHGAKVTVSHFVRAFLCLSLCEYIMVYFSVKSLDLSAIPDFQSGAMENWGWPTYQESVLFYNSEKSSASSKLWISSMVIAHELQWFGNLVTMEWWNDLWLNVGFAKFMEFMSVTQLFLELQNDRMESQNDYFLRRCFYAMAVDALNSSQPLSTRVEGPAQILEMFDNVSYEKGSCILNMLRDYLTADVFKAGLLQYLQKYKFLHTHFCFTVSVLPSSTSYMSSFSLATKNKHWTKGETLDVRATMGTWTRQKGFPLLTVTVRGKNVHLQQENFCEVLPLNKALLFCSRYLWHIPLNYITSKSDTVQRFLMTTKMLLSFRKRWSGLNSGWTQMGMVHYEDDGWDHLINLLKENYTVISSKDRAISKTFDLTLYLKHERQIVPVLQGMNELIAIYRLMERRDMDGTEKHLFKYLIDKQYQPCVDKAKGYFTEWQKSNGTLSLPADVKTTVYAVGAQTSEGRDFLLSRYRMNSFSGERENMKLALNLSRSKDKLQWLMDQGLHGDIIRTQDLPFIVVFVAKTSSGYHLPWTFLKENWEKVVEK